MAPHRNKNNENIVIKTQQRVVTQVPVLENELESLGQMGRMESIAMNFGFTALGGVLGSVPAAFVPVPVNTLPISLIVFWACLVGLVLSFLFAWLGHNSKSSITKNIKKKK